MTYGDTLFSAIFLGYNFPRSYTQGGFVNAPSSDARVEIELHGHCFHAVINFFNQACTRTREKLTTFSLASAGKAGLPQAFAGRVTQGGGQAVSNSSPKNTRGNWYLHWDTSACEKASPAPAERWLHFTEDTSTGGDPSHAGRGGAFTGQSFHWVIFLCLGLPHFGKKPFLAPPEENSRHETAMFCFFNQSAGALSRALQPWKAPSPGTPRGGTKMARQPPGPAVLGATAQARSGEGQRRLRWVCGAGPSGEGVHEAGASQGRLSTTKELVRCVSTTRTGSSLSGASGTATSRARSTAGQARSGTVPSAATACPSACRWTQKGVHGSAATRWAVAYKAGKAPWTARGHLATQN